jgi:amino acid adenylation domain-containing protein
MTAEPPPSCTDIRPRRAAAATASPAHARLELSQAAAQGLARISGGRVLEELVALAAASALVVGCAESITAPGIAVAGPAGPVVFGVDTTMQATLADLVRAVDAALRVAPVLANPGETLAHCLLVRVAGLGAGRAAGGVRQASIELTLSSAGPGGGRELQAEADPDRTESWFLDVLLRAVAETLAGFAQPHRLLASLIPAAPEDLSAAARFGRSGFSPELAATTLLAPVRALVRSHPENTAVVAGVDSLTYQELWRAAGGVAARLTVLGIGAGDRVALFARKTPHTVAAILGTMLAGAAYVPLDPQSPAARLAGILSDAGCGAILVTRDLAGQLPATNPAPVIDIESAVQLRGHELPGPSPEDIAYVIYTSGSTGTPKGVSVRHRAISSYVRWKLEYHQMDTETRVLQLPSLAFDSSVADLFPVLASGGRLVLVDATEVRPRQLADLVERHRITHLMAVPSMYRLVLEHLGGGSGSLRLVTVAGEALPADLVRRHHQALPGVRLVNEYGPTENSVGATAFDHAQDAGPGFPIGRPIPNTVVTVHDPAGRTMPTGYVGELWLAGHGLADGYHNRPDLSAEAFVTDPGAPGGRSYRTGDLAWWRPDGLLEFAGRVDDQVKIRGHRVELGEVRSALSRVPGVHAVGVIIAEDANGTPAVVAYLEATDVTAEVIRERAAELLPPAMIPARIQLIDVLPRLVSGKPDLQALAEMAAAQPPVTAQPPVKADLTDLETVVAGIFEESLGIGPIEADTDFFVAGGHSLLALTVLDLVEQRLGVSLDLDDFFANATVRDTAALIRQGAEATAPGEPAPDYPPVRPVDAEALRRLIDGGAR